jgi:hypothetical protein
MFILRLQRESLDSEGVKLFEKKEETIPSPPSTVQRETIIDPVDPVDPVAPVDVPRDMAVGQRGLHGLDRLCRRQRDMQLLVVHSERARDHIDF